MNLRCLSTSSRSHYSVHSRVQDSTAKERAHITLTLNISQHTQFGLFKDVFVSCTHHLTSLRTCFSTHFLLNIPSRSRTQYVRCWKVTEGPGA